MFKKQKLSFKSKDIFEAKFKSDIDSCFCVVSKMLFMNIINIDGSIDLDKSGFVKKYELWSYIYYLYTFNNTNISEFIEMKNKKNNKASSVLFYDIVTITVGNEFKANSALLFDINTLIYFINIIIHKYNNKLINPVIDYLTKILKKEIIPSLGSISIKTGNSSQNVKITNANANVKVKLSLSEN